MIERQRGLELLHGPIALRQELDDPDPDRGWARALKNRALNACSSPVAGVEFIGIVVLAYVKMMVRKAKAMGLYFARTRRTTWDELSASITWREYSSALSAVTDPGDRGQGRDRFATSALPYVGGRPDESAIVVLSEQVRRRPQDATAHRRLGLTHLARGQHEPAVRHLEIAYRLVRRHAQRAVGLTDALHLQCEAAMLRLVLMRLYMRLGKVDRARSLAQEAQAVL